jgi:cation transport ATPase
VSAEAPQQMVYFISGMWCSTCAKNIRTSVAQIDGVETADLNYATKLLTIKPKHLHPAAPLDESIQTEVHRIGFGIKKQPKNWAFNFYESLRAETNRRIPWVQVSLVWFLAMWSSMVAFAGYMGGGLTPGELYKVSLFSSAFGLPAILIGIFPYAQSGLRAFFLSRLLTLDLFIFIGGCSAVAISIISLLSHSHLTYADSGSMIIAVLLLTKKLENTAFVSMTSRILYQIRPKDNFVEVLKKGEWTKADPSQIRKGDLVKVARMETIPFDGILENSEAAINNHLMNGEADSIQLKKGDHIFAGAIAQSPLELSVVSPQGERKIDTWAESALLSAGHQTKYAKIFSKIESRLVVISLTGAFAVAAVRALAGDETKSIVEAFFVGILVFCPCLFASIIPLTKQFVYLALLKRGVLLQRDDALLDLCRVSNFYIDKTGTLEAVESVYVPREENLNEVLPYLKALSENSKHPVLRGLQPLGEASPIEDIDEYAGKGLIAKARDGAELIVGRPEFLNKRGIDVSGFDTAIPLVALNQKIAGQIITKSVYDLRAKSFLKRLLAIVPHSKIEILSGDPRKTEPGTYTDLDRRIHYRGNLSPEEKAGLIHGPAAFIGDGLNDTLALAKANVSFRLGHRVHGFAPVDFQMRTPNLNLIADTILYAKKYRRVLLQTALAALLYNAMALTLAGLGMFSPLGAVSSMLASLSIMLLSVIRLIKVPQK